MRTEMGGYSKMLVAYDDSESSRNALKQAVEKFPEGWIKVLGVLPAYEGDLAMIGVRDMAELRRGPRADWLAAARRLTADDAGRTQIELRQGDAFEEIVHMAEGENCSLIVMGRHGLHRVERMLMGSVTAKVIVHARCDVLVIPSQASIDWQRILVAVDGSDYCRKALDKALDYAIRRSGRVTAASVVDIYPEYYAEAGNAVEKMEKKAASRLDEARQRAAAAGVAIDTRILVGDPAEELTSLARKLKFGIIFAGSRGKSHLRQIFLGSVAQKVIGLAPCAVYIAKA